MKTIKEMQEDIYDILSELRPEGWDEYTKVATAALADVKRAAGDISSSDYPDPKEYATKLADHLSKWLDEYEGPELFKNHSSTAKATASSAAFEIMMMLRLSAES